MSGPSVVSVAASAPAGPGADPAAARGGLVDTLLAHGLRNFDAPTVLDCGGGSGRYAVPLAAGGAMVTVVDVSIDALATLRRRAAEAGVAERVVAVQGDVEALTDAIGGDTFDVVLAHGILEMVESPAQSLAAAVSAVGPGGLLSVLVGNPVAAVLARALAGDLAGAERELRDLDSAAVTPATLLQLCADHGLVVDQVHGVGVFRDIVPGAALDATGARDTLARLEQACAQRRPFAEIAGRVHLLARRPAS